MQKTFKDLPSKEIYVASIDIGTNSTHLLIAQINLSLKSFSIKFTEKSTTRLGERDEEGNLRESSIQKVLDTLKTFKDYCTSYKVTEILAAATSAVRESPNGGELIQRIKEDIGFKVELISGVEEARLIYLGVLSGMALEDKSYVIIDIGGGSTELILANNEDTQALTSSRVGAVRLKNDFFDKSSLSKSRVDFLKTFIKGSLEPSVTKIRKRLSRNERIALIATSGTATSLGNLIAYELTQSKQKMHGYQFTKNDLDKILEKLINMSESERRKVPFLSERRAEIIIPGALILNTSMEMLGAEELTLSERSLREGLVVDWMLRRGMLKSKFTIQSNVRRTTVLHQAQKFGVDESRSEKLQNLAMSIYEQTKNILHDDQNNIGKNLLWAACYLFTCGKHINLSAYHKHSWYLIKNFELLGYSHSEINIIASIARYHRKTLPKKRHESWQTLNTREEKKIVLEMSLILRLASALDKRPDSSISSIDIQLLDKKLLFRIIPLDLNKDLLLEKWSLKSCSDVLKELKDLELEVS